LAAIGAVVLAGVAVAAVVATGGSNDDSTRGRRFVASFDALAARFHSRTWSAAES
jgi:hypothetical protein